jgi:ADP-ribose pyrophosphatase
MSNEAHVTKVSPLDSKDAKWVQLQKIDWTDSFGNQKVWEVATRKTRGSSGIDAVAIAPILLGKTVSTLIIHQFRPPVNAMCVEFPAGLIDEGETIEQTALRELKEETGLEGRVIKVSPTVCSDPGMTNANMQLVTVECDWNEGDELPEQDLQDSEDIEREIAPLKGLYQRLLELSSQGRIVDAKLFHWAEGLNFALESADKYRLR